MANIPTYADLKAKQAEAAAIQNQQQQKMNIAQQVEQQANDNQNRVLQDYMHNKQVPVQQGLTPQQVDPVVEHYNAVKNEVGKNSKDPQDFLINMVNLAKQGQIPKEYALQAESEVQQQLNPQQRGLS